MEAYLIYVPPLLLLLHFWLNNLLAALELQKYVYQPLYLNEQHQQGWKTGQALKFYDPRRKRETERER